MNYELKHFDTTLVRFFATEDTNAPEIKILWTNEYKKELFPLDLELTNEGIAKWLKNRTIPKNRAYVHNFLSKCGLNINRPMTIIKVSKGPSLNDCYWVVEEGFDGPYDKFNLYDNRFSQVLAMIAFTGYGSSVRTSLASCPEFTTKQSFFDVFIPGNIVYRMEEVFDLFAFSMRQIYRGRKSTAAQLIYRNFRFCKSEYRFGKLA